jgi:L-aspartate oxidase
MKRYILNNSLQNANRINTDVMIAGSGAAGLYTALNLDPRLQCVVLNKAGMKHSSSMYAQGGIAAVMQPSIGEDSPEQHMADTLVAGAGLCDENAVRVLVNEAWSNIEQLIKLNVPFDRQDGGLLLTREGGHGRNRILHCGGDATGAQLTRSLYKAAMERDNINILSMMSLSDIVTNEDGASGVLALDEQNELCYITASSVVIATGGIGRVYRNSTNSVCATGDGIAAARRAGAALHDMEFVQFHPTAFVHPHDNGRFFLISEAMRGEGAILRNRRSEPFMQGVHPLADLAPRDIVSRAIVNEMKKSDIPNVYLDITDKPRKFLRNRFPTIYEECMFRGVDIAKDWIPVMPVQHYFMGGIKTDLDGRTSLPGLYACGEAARTGVHGANRLASNSLLECLVFGRRCALHINGSQAGSRGTACFTASIGKDAEEADLDSYINEIRVLMTHQCGIVRNEKDLLEAQDRICAIFEQLDAMALTAKKSIDTYNMSQVALEILKAALLRRKSVGAHYRSDGECLGGESNA